jgi:hypothetical protein
VIAEDRPTDIIARVEEALASRGYRRHRRSRARYSYFPALASISARVPPCSTVQFTDAAAQDVEDFAADVAFEGGQ